jgi:hypothetical protein
MSLGRLFHPKCENDPCHSEKDLPHLARMNIHSQILCFSEHVCLCCTYPVAQTVEQPGYGLLDYVVHMHQLRQLSNQFTGC